MKILKTLNSEIQNLVNNSVKSVVEIGVLENVTRSSFNPLKYIEGDLQLLSSGSGFFFKKNGYILTNSHVVEKSSDVVIRTYDQKYYEAEIIGVDQIMDIAVLKVDSTRHQIANQSRLKSPNLGEIVVAIGHPHNEPYTVTMGIISGISRIVQSTEIISSIYLQTDASINPGNSGGPLLDVDGNVIGINTLSVDPNFAENMAYSIPFSFGIKVAERLIKYGKVSYGTIGILDGFDDQEIDKELRSQFNIKQKKAFYLTDVATNCEIYEHGIVMQSYLLKLNNQIITKYEQILDVCCNVDMIYESVKATFLVPCDENSLDYTFKEMYIEIKNIHQL